MDHCINCGRIMREGQMCWGRTPAWPCRSRRDQSIVTAQVGGGELVIKTGWNATAVPILEDPYASI